MRLALVLVVALALGLACQTDTTPIEERLDAIEERLDAQDQQLEDALATLAAAPPVIETVVISTYSQWTYKGETRRWGTAYCVAYTVAGSAQTSCYSAAAATCYAEAKVGEPLPQSCR